MKTTIGVEHEQLKSKLPAFTSGDTLRVHHKVLEGGRERVQTFEGTVIARKSGGVRETFTVRRISHGVGVEKTFPLHSPRIDRIDIVRKGKVRQAKLYHLRGKIGRQARIKELR